MNTRDGGPLRPLLLPEVLQTSPLDCGPAALAALLAGFGLRQPCERLRDACRTGRDGTSIDALESVAVEQGLDAEQILVPVDHLALPEAACLPCILVVRQPGGATHFVVVWRRHGRRAQVMDPAAGRCWPTVAALEREVYRHRAVVPAAVWHAWAVSAGLREPLAARLEALGLAATERSALIERLARGGGGGDGGGGRLADPALDCRAAPALDRRAIAPLDWRAVAALDAAVRFTRQLVAAGGVRRGREASRILAALLERLARQLPAAGGGGVPAAPSDGGGAPVGPSDGGGAPVGPGDGGAPPIVPASCWSVRLAPPGPGGEERLEVEGAVLVRVRGRRPSVEPAASARAPRHRLQQPTATAAPRPVPARPRAAGREAPEIGRRGPCSPGQTAAAGGPVDLPRPRSSPAAGVPAGLPRLPSDVPAWLTLALATLGAAAGRLAEVALFAACIELLPALGSRSVRLAALGSLLCLGVALLGLELTGARTALALGRGSETVLRLRLAVRLPRLPDRYLRTRAVADLAERAHLLVRVRRGPELLAATLRAGVDAALAAAGIAWLDPPLAGAALAAGATALLVPILLLPPLAERSRRASAHAAALAGFYLDVLRGLAAVHAHQAAPALRRRHDELLAGWLRARRSAAAAAGWLEVSTQALLCAAAAGLVLDHVRRQGVDARTLVLALWAFQLLGAGQRLAMLAGRDLPLHRTLMRRIEEPLAADSAGTDGAAEAERAAGDAARTERTTAEDGIRAAADGATPGATSPAAVVAADDGTPAGSAGGDDGLAGVAIGFAACAIETDGRALLRDLDFEIPAGQHVAILGRSGAGKSTLLGALLGWYRPAAGVLLCDGRPLDPRGLAELRRATAWVAPDVTLWAAPLLDNLCYGLDAGACQPGQADRMTPAEALRAAQLLDLLPQLPQGLQTALGEAGGRLSGGEAMRVRLARALLRPGVRLALLDEPCRGLGADQRRDLLAAARDRWRRATLLCVTHSPAEAAGFDRLLILEDGRVAEDGIPGRLAGRLGSRYRALLDAEARAGAALEAPGWRRLRLAGGRLREPPRAGAAAAPPPSLPGGAVESAAAPGATFDDFAQAGAAGVEADAVEIGWAELERALPRLGPAVLQLPSGRGLLAAPRVRGRRVALLTPDGRRLRLSAAELARALRQPVERRLAAGIEPLVGGLSLAPRRRRRACRGLLAAHLAAAPGCIVYLVAPAIVSRPGRRPAEPTTARLAFRAVALLAALVAGQALVLGGWVLLGSGLLAARLDRARMLAWALLLLTVPLVRAVELSAAAVLGHRAVLLLRSRLAAALLSLAPETVRGEATGRLMGRLLAAESIERLLLAAVPAMLLAAAELAGAGGALAHGAAPKSHLALLLGALLGAAALTRRYARAQCLCAASRRDLTGRLVEELTGHRTHLAQRGGGPAPLDDPLLAAFHAAVRRLDAVAAWLRSALPRAWLFAGLALLAATLAPGAAGGTDGGAAGLAASLGGLLLAQAGLGRLAAGLCDLAAARAAGRELRPFLAAEDSSGSAVGGGPRASVNDLPAEAAVSPGAEPSQALPPGSLRSPSGRPQPPSRGGPLRLSFGRPPLLVEARDLACRPPDRPRPILAGAALTVRRGDRLLLAGPSGSGKSTLAALLAAQLAPDSGLLLLDGFDLPTTGARAWRRRVVAVPQLHANHLFADTLAFNLLLGRGWPPAAGDLAEAAALCRDLGLGPLLDRLPAGLEQRIGEAGWRLSDGEASRVCLARALLQDPALLILDESLAALDPETRLLALDVAAKRARTLLLIAHVAPS